MASENSKKCDRKFKNKGLAKVKGTQKSGTDPDEKSWQKVKILIMKKLPLILKKRPHETIKITAEIKKSDLIL